MLKNNQISEKSTKIIQMPGPSPTRSVNWLRHSQMVVIALLTSAGASSCSDGQTPVYEEPSALQTITMPRALRESCVNAAEIEFLLEANGVAQPATRQADGWLVNMQVEQGEPLVVEVAMSSAGVKLAELQRNFGVVNSSIVTNIIPSNYTYPDDDADSASNLDEICGGTDPFLADQTAPEDSQTSIRFVSNSYSVDEAAGSLDIYLERSGSSVGAIEIRITGRDGTATAGLDFVPGAYYASWADGESGVRSATIIVLDDNEVEDTEVFELVLVNQTNPSDITAFDRGTVATVNIASDDVSNVPEFIPVSDDFPCGIEDGTDNDSRTAAWDDNCTIRRGSAQPGQFANSMYTLGIQRILHCAGYGTGTSYDSFGNGDFDQATEDAVKEFQRSSPDPITDDGVVGAQTWAKLQSALSRTAIGVEIGTSNGVPTTDDTYGFISGPCTGFPLFYQIISFDSNENEIPGSWFVAGNPPDYWIHAPFSISPPFDSFRVSR